VGDDRDALGEVERRASGRGLKMTRKPAQPALNVDVDDDEDRVDVEEKDVPPRLRLKLKTIDDVSRELARVYRLAKSRQRDTQDCSRLANILQILGRMIEGGQLEARVAALEQALEHRDGVPRRDGGEAWPAQH
jgi:hypothetical protein